MSANAETKVKAVELRKSGKTIPQIADMLGIARSTAYVWLSDLPLSAERRHIGRLCAASASHAAVARKSEEARWKYVDDAKAEWPNVRDEQVVIAGVCLYAAEGRQREKHRNTLSFSNCDHRMISIMMRFFQRLGVRIDQISFHIQLPNPPTVAADEAVNYWMEALDVDRDAIRGVYVQTIPRKKKPTFPYGVCAICFSDARVSEIVHTWKGLLLDELVA